MDELIERGTRLSPTRAALLLSTCCSISFNSCSFISNSLTSCLHSSLTRFPCISSFSNASSLRPAAGQNPHLRYLMGHRHHRPR
ncbi:hypothetical protein BDZ94DRAFT_1250717 [Collybia nuda]|uniref:Uncharacterized protein n=1 Tax=Collybia nuda TaxID=64659 RepID=A0A9P6CNK8_9AGAR|nr:hypothetical protein BDZ94DRAFT_1250717 [Collybia nuda]